MSALQNSNARTIIVMHGDQTGEELLKEALRVLDPGGIGLELDFQDFDLSLQNRRATKNQVVREAADAMLRPMSWSADQLVASGMVAKSNSGKTLRVSNTSEPSTAFPPVPGGSMRIR